MQALKTEKEKLEKENTAEKTKLNASEAEVSTLRAQMVTNNTAYQSALAENKAAFEKELQAKKDSLSKWMAAEWAAI